MFGSLFIAPIVDAVSAVLKAVSLEDGDLVVVVEQPRIARALAEQHGRVLMVAAKPRSLRRQQGLRVYGTPEALPLGDAAAAALIVVGQGHGESWEARFGEWRRVVADGGVLALVDRTPAAEASRRALCGGLAQIEQRDAGRAVVTSGLVVRI